MKKKILLLISVLAIVFLYGCSTYKLDLTASEHDKIAEYAAYALLGDAEDYKNKLLSSDEVDRIIAERELESQIRDEIDRLEPTTNKPQNPTTPQETTSPGDIDIKETTTKKDEPEVIKTLDDILAIANVSVQYSGYELCKIFPNDTSEFVVLKPKKGKQFIALSFVLQNTSNEQAECNLLRRDIVYRLHLANGENYKSMLSAMGNDFGTWNTPLAPQSMNMAFMLFEVPDTITAQDMVDAELSFRENKATHSVVLQ